MVVRRNPPKSRFLACKEKRANADGRGLAAAALQAKGLIRSRANSNNDLPRAPFVPNVARNCGHSQLIMVSLFLVSKETALPEHLGSCLQSWSWSNDQNLWMVLGEVT
jgi:hypothetical protein